MFCSNCGKPIEGNANFCPYCGHGTAGSVDQENTMSKNATPSIPKLQLVTSVFDSELFKKIKAYCAANRGRAIGLAIISLLLIGIIGFNIWVGVSFPGASMDDVLEDMSLSKATVPLSLGESFGQDDVAITPVEVTYVSSSLFYNDYGDPYASIVLDITCLSGTWEPEYENIKFWLDDSSAFNQPSYEQIKIKRGQTQRYTFTHPLITSSTQAVDMRLVLECKTGATIELYFSVDGVQEFFNGGYYYDYSDNYYSDSAFQYGEDGLLVPIPVNIKYPYGYYEKKSGEALDFTAWTEPAGMTIDFYSNGNAYYYGADEWTESDFYVNVPFDTFDDSRRPWSLIIDDVPVQIDIFNDHISVTASGSIAGISADMLSGDYYCKLLPIAGQ